MNILSEIIVYINRGYASLLVTMVEEGYKGLSAEVNEVRARLDLLDEQMSIVEEYIGSRN